MKTLKQTDELQQYLQQVSLPREVADSLTFSMQLVEQCNAGKSYADKISSIRIMDECEGYGDLLKCSTFESDEVILTDNGAWLRLHTELSKQKRLPTLGRQKVYRKFLRYSP